MTHVSMQELQDNPTGILRRIRHGEELLLEEDGVAFGRFIPIASSAEGARDAPVRRTPAEGLGLLKGQIGHSLDVKGPFAADVEELFNGHPDKFR